MVTAFKKAEGVSDCKVDFKAKTATVTYKKADTTEEKLEKALEGTRYKIAGKAEEEKQDEKQQE